MILSMQQVEIQLKIVIVWSFFSKDDKPAVLPFLLCFQEFFSGWAENTDILTAVGGHWFQ